MDTVRDFDAMVGVSVEESTPDRVVMAWDIRPELHQPFGIVHGGVYCAVIESAASRGGMNWYSENYPGLGNVVGVSNHTDFLRAVSEGHLTATATPIHRGRSQQLWLVEIVDGSERLIARGQVRLQNLSKR